MSTPDRRGMLDPLHASLSVRRQCELVGVARSGFYRARMPNDDADLAVMKRLDQLFTERPFYGSRRMTLQLRQEGHEINRKRLQRLMRRTGMVALGPKLGDRVRSPTRDSSATEDGQLSPRTLCSTRQESTIHVASGA